METRNEEVYNSPEQQLLWRTEGLVNDYGMSKANTGDLRAIAMQKGMVALLDNVGEPDIANIQKEIHTINGNLLNANATIEEAEQGKARASELVSSNESLRAFIKDGVLNLYKERESIRDKIAMYREGDGMFSFYEQKYKGVEKDFAEYVDTYSQIYNIDKQKVILGADAEFQKMLQGKTVEQGDDDRK